MEKHTAEGKLLKVGISATDEGGQNNGKGKQREVSAVPSDPGDSGDENLSHSPAGEEHGKKRGALQNRLRECRLTLHRTKFLQGDMYHALGEAHSASEDAAYEAAEKIRRDLLKGELSVLSLSSATFSFLLQAQRTMQNVLWLYSSTML